MKKYIIGGVIVFFIFFFVLVSKSVRPATQNQNPTVEKSETATPTSAKTYNYKIIETEELKTVDNYFVLVDSGETAVEKIASEVNNSCKKSCNIDIFDDSRAFELDKEYKNLTEPVALEKWKKDNYVFVADHLVGEILFSGNYTSYPMKDWYYKQLKGEK
jgi:hypothetical protein